MTETPQQKDKDKASQQQAKQDWLQQGDNFAAQKRYEEALLAYEQAIRLDTQDALVYKNKGVMLGELGSY